MKQIMVSPIGHYGQKAVQFHYGGFDNADNSPRRDLLHNP